MCKLSTVPGEDRGWHCPSGHRLGFWEVLRPRCPVQGYNWYPSARDDPHVQSDTGALSLLLLWRYSDAGLFEAVQCKGGIVRAGWGARDPACNQFTSGRAQGHSNLVVAAGQQ